MEHSLSAGEHAQVGRARAGDGEPLCALLEQHEAKLRRRLDRSVTPPLRRCASAADVLQETWLVAFRRIAEFEDLKLADDAARVGRSYGAVTKFHGRAALRLSKDTQTGRAP